MTALHLRSIGIGLAASFGIAVTPAAGQDKTVVQIVDGKVQQKGGERPDETKGMVNLIQEAYKAPVEVDKDIRDELRKQYQNPTPEREQKILREVRRLYVTSPEQEQRIVQELRRAYDVQSPDQEEAVFAEVRRMGKLTPGTVPVSVQNAQAEKLFTRFDQNRDGVLGEGELPDGLTANLGRWDANRDGVIEPREYWAYYQVSLKVVSDKVASGEIAIKLPPGVTLPKLSPEGPQEYKLQVFRAGKLPEGLPGWFVDLDEDNDGQVGLYEWRVAGWDLDAFAAMDQNADGLLTPDECLKWMKLSVEERARAEAATRAAPRIGVQPGGRKPAPTSEANSLAKQPKVVEKTGPGGEPVVVLKPGKGGDAPPKGDKPAKGGGPPKDVAKEVQKAVGKGK